MIFGRCRRALLRLALTLAGAAAVASLVVACAPAKKPEPKPVVPAAPPPAAAEAREPESPPMPPTLVVIDRGGEEKPRSLAEASRAERERRGREGKRPQAAVITDQNLAEYAAKGQLTEAKPGPPPGTQTADAKGPGATAPGDPTAPALGDQAAAAPGDTSAEGGPRDEAYWSGRAREIRQRWRQSADEIAALEKESAALRWKFYAEDDPYFRDQQIKPEWDRVLEDLRRARQDVRAYQRELADFMEEGRRAGALPGWLREGIELEPAQPEAAPANEQSPEHQSIEPPIVDEPQR